MSEELAKPLGLACNEGLCSTGAGRIMGLDGPENSNRASNDLSAGGEEARLRVEAEGLACPSCGRLLSGDGITDEMITAGGYLIESCAEVVGPSSLARLVYIAMSRAAHPL